MRTTLRQLPALRALRLTTPRALPLGYLRTYHTTSPLGQRAPATPPPTDFNELNVLGSTPVPSTSIDVCFYNGFGLNSGVTISDGNGALLVNGEAFEWRPWEGRADGEKRVINAKGQFDVPDQAWGVLELLWPKPDLLVIGVGKHIRPLSPQTRRRVAELGMRVEVLDTRNAASQFNLLATERGVGDVAAALIPIGWQDGIGVEED